jgi:hypothetical protein
VETYLILLTGEVISTLRCTLDTLLQARVSPVVSTKDRVLESRWVLELQLQLAEFAAFGGRDVGAGLDGVSVKGEGHGGAVIGEEALDRLVRATSAAVCDCLDFDFVAGGGILGGRRGHGDGAQGEDGGKCLHSGGE